MTPTTSGNIAMASSHSNRSELHFFLHIERLVKMIARDSRMTQIDRVLSVLTSSSPAHGERTPSASRTDVAAP